MVRTQDPLRSIFGAKELPGLCSHLFLATPPPRYTTLIIIPGSFGPKPCAPLVDPFSSGTLFGPGVTEGFKNGGISPSLLPGSERVLPIAIRKISLRPYARGRLGLRKVQDGEAIPEPTLD